MTTISDWAVCELAGESIGAMTGIMVILVGVSLRISSDGVVNLSSMSCLALERPPNNREKRRGLPVVFFGVVF